MEHLNLTSLLNMATYFSYMVRRDTQETHVCYVKAKRQYETSGKQDTALTGGSQTGTT